MMYRMRIIFSKTRESIIRETQANALVSELFDAFISDLVHERQLRHTISESDIYHILNAAQFAAERHHEQTRLNRNKTPYIIHPLQVARNLLTIGHIYDADVLMAALLHDTIEDTETEEKELADLFGYQVQHLVKEVSDDKTLSKEERKRLQIQNASQKSTKAALIVLADKLANLIDIMHDMPVGWDEERINDYFLWAHDVIRQLPEVNPNLLTAVEEVIEEFWKSRAQREYDY